MSISFSVKVDGLKNVTRKYRSTYPQKIKKNIIKQNKNIGLLIQKTARKYAPEKTGALVNSIRFKSSASGIELYVRQGRASRYAPIMEYGQYKPGEGTRRKTDAGRLYLHRAIEDNHDKIVFMMSKAFDGVKD